MQPPQNAASTSNQSAVTPAYSPVYGTVHTPNLTAHQEPLFMGGGSRSIPPSLPSLMGGGSTLIPPSLPSLMGGGSRLIPPSLPSLMGRGS